MARSFALLCVLWVLVHASYASMQQPATLASPCTPVGPPLTSNQARNASSPLAPPCAPVGVALASTTKRTASPSTTKAAPALRTSSSSKRTASPSTTKFSIYRGYDGASYSYSAITPTPTTATPYQLSAGQIGAGIGIAGGAAAVGTIVGASVANPALPKAAWSKLKGLFPQQSPQRKKPAPPQKTASSASFARGIISTSLTSDVQRNDTILPVGSLGFMAAVGDRITIGSGPMQETHTIIQSGTSLVIRSGLLFPHARREPIQKVSGRASRSPMPKRAQLQDPSQKVSGRAPRSPMPKRAQPQARGRPQLQARQIQNTTTTTTVTATAAASSTSTIGIFFIGFGICLLGLAIAVAALLCCCDWRGSRKTNGNKKRGIDSAREFQPSEPQEKSAIVEAPAPNTSVEAGVAPICSYVDIETPLLPPLLPVIRLWSPSQPIATGVDALPQFVPIVQSQRAMPVLMPQTLITETTIETVPQSYVVDTVLPPTLNGPSRSQGRSVRPI